MSITTKSFLHFKELHAKYKQESTCPSYLSSPHEPQLEDVYVASTLQRFVPSVIGQVVVFVLLEQVAGVHLVAVLHQTL